MNYNFIERASNKHNNKYIYTKVEYKNSNTKIIIICPIHGEFLQIPSSHLNGHGCQLCASQKLSSLYRGSADSFIEKSKKHINHQDKNYDYSKVNYINNRTKVTIICPSHGEFLQTPTSHTQGIGCPKCGIETICKKLRKTTTQFIEDSKKIHSSKKYNYSKVEYINDRTKVIIICPLHGEFLQTPDSHVQGFGCQKCGFDTTGKKLTSTTSEFIKKAMVVHSNKYNYEAVQYINDRIKIKILCDIHGVFLQSPNRHLQGNGCPRCKYNISKIASEWLNMIKVSIPHLITYNDIRGEYRIPNTYYFADGYDDKTNTIYEFHGDYWHGNPTVYNQDDINPSTKSTYGNLYNNTLKKRNLCRSLGYNYIEIWESEWKKFKLFIIKKQKEIKNNY
jgi:hypothetical protein